MDKEVFNRMLLTDDTTVKMALDLGVSTATIDRAKKRVRDKIKKTLMARGESIEKESKCSNSSI